MLKIQLWQRPTGSSLGVKRLSVPFSVHADPYSTFQRDNRKAEWELHDGHK